MKPLLKWAGGKRAIAHELQSRFPKGWDRGTYIEPFLGGGAVFLHLGPKKAIVSDINSRLIGFYRHVRNSPETLIAGIESNAAIFDSLPTQDEKLAFYLSVRKRFNESEADSIASAVDVFTLNKLCFNGLYRENASGGFNVPFGNKKSFPTLEKAVFLEVSELLRNTEILNLDFETTISKANSGDFVYLDPPYIPLVGSPSFTSYHASGFGLKEQIRLASLMVELRDRGVKAMCSNSDTPLTRLVFSALRLDQLFAPRMVSASASGRGSVSELVITNY